MASAEYQVKPGKKSDVCGKIRHLKSKSAPLAAPLCFVAYQVLAIWLFLVLICSQHF